MIYEPSKKTVMVRKFKDKNKSLKVVSGFSLVEMLVVIFVFSILGVVSTQILALSLRNSKKSESMSDVRTNLEYTVSIMERLLRNANSINVANCTTNRIKLEFTDEKDNDCWFECITSGSDTYIASDSAVLSPVRLTSTDVRVVCSNIFSCTDPADEAPEIVTIELTGEDAELGTGVEGSRVTVRTQLQLRNYESN